MSSAVRRDDPAEYAEAERESRAARERVADQVHDLIIERQSMGSDVEFVQRVRELGEVRRRVLESQGRQKQAVEMGLPVGVHVQAEREARQILRSTAMHAAASIGAWVAAMDFEEERRGEAGK